MTLAIYADLPMIGQSDWFKPMLNALKTYGQKPLITTSSYSRLVPSWNWNLMVDPESIRGLCIQPPVFS